jgi:DNA mismatch repair ATPase MutS
MLQAGLFVGAKSLKFNLTEAIYTHFDREEDTNMESGKLDDELKRLSLIIDNIKPNSTILLNESFQSTNEREGSLIGFEITKALLDSNINVVLVTHMFELSNDIKNEYNDSSIFMRAERNDDGSRTFKISENETLRTSFAMDLYNKIFN